MKLILVTLFCFAQVQLHAKLTIASYNIRNFDYDQRSRVPTNKNKLYETLAAVNADFLAVQEINQTKVFDDYVDRRFFGRYSVALSECGGAHDQRLGFMYDNSKLQLLSFKEDLRVTNPKAPNQGFCKSGSRPLAVGEFKIKKSGETFVAISLHFKSGGQQRSIQKRFKQLGILKTVIEEHRARGQNNFVVMGDFNTTEFKAKGEVYNDFMGLLGQMRLKNVSASLGCTAYWWGGKPDGKEYPSQLDHILVSGVFEKKADQNAKVHGHCAQLSCSVADEDAMGPSYDEVSDHCPIASDFSL